MENRTLTIIVIALSVWAFMATGASLYQEIQENNKIDGINSEIGDLRQKNQTLNQEVEDLKGQLPATPAACNQESEDQASERELAATKLRDARRISDMRTLVAAQEFYYGEHDQYLISAVYPESIGTSMPITPQDPKGIEYEALGNTGDSERFCFYTRLEIPNTSAKGCTEKPCYFYTASENGNFYKTMEPAKLGSTDESGCAIEK